MTLCSLGPPQTVLCSPNRSLRYTKGFVSILYSTKYGTGVPEERGG